MLFSPPFELAVARGGICYQGVFVFKNYKLFLPPSCMITSSNNIHNQFLFRRGLTSYFSTALGGNVNEHDSQVIIISLVNDGAKRTRSNFLMRVKYARLILSFMFFFVSKSNIYRTYGVENTRTRLKNLASTYAFVLWPSSAYATGCFFLDWFWSGRGVVKRLGTIAQFYFYSEHSRPWRLLVYKKITWSSRGVHAPFFGPTFLFLQFLSIWHGD